MPFARLLSGAELALARSDMYPGRPTLVFLHDSLGCITLWRDFPEKLGHLTCCNLLVYDRQGYGQSDPFTALTAPTGTWSSRPMC